jgi:hypothetical protein
MRAPTILSLVAAVLVVTACGKKPEPEQPAPEPAPPPTSGNRPARPSPRDVWK